MNPIEITPLVGFPEVKEGDNLGLLIVDTCSKEKIEIVDGSILVVAQKIVSKAEGKLVKLANEEDYLLLLEREAKKIIRKRGNTIIAETQHGFICANAGIDRSNIKKGHALLLPEDPDKSAEKIRKYIENELDIHLGVIISDTFGRAWRNGQINVAIGVSGIDPIKSYIGEKDTFENELNVTEIAIVDELSSAAELVMGKTEKIPVALINNYKFNKSDEKIDKIIRKQSDDYFL